MGAHRQHAIKIYTVMLSIFVTCCNKLAVRPLIDSGDGNTANEEVSTYGLRNVRCSERTRPSRADHRVTVEFAKFARSLLIHPPSRPP